MPGEKGVFLVLASNLARTVCRCADHEHTGLSRIGHAHLLAQAFSLGILIIHRGQQEADLAAIEFLNGGFANAVADCAGHVQLGTAGLGKVAASAG